MYYPSVSERVRVRGRAGNFVVHSVDHAAYAADVHALANPAAIERDLAFDLLSASPEAGAIQSRIIDPRDSRPAVMGLLRATQHHLDRSRALLTDIHESIRSTLQLIRASQQRIQESDRVIARARTLGCEGDKRNLGG